MLTLRDVHKRFGSRVAVDGVSLSLAAGEVFGLLGPNGAGKTTTLRMAVGLTEPDDGSVELTGYGNPRSTTVRARLGYAPQSLCVYDELSARENLTLMAGLYGLRGAKAKAQVAWALDFVSLTDRADERSNRFSIGMKRRLTLATAIVHQPELLVLDEPTAGVDPQSRNAIFNNIRALRERGVTVLYTTHFMEEAELLCDRVAIMDQGRIIAQDSVPALLDAASNKRPAAPVREHTSHVLPPRMSALEQLFLDLTGRELRDT
jgi:ABC-2 type transport system ATP-binding protein